MQVVVRNILLCFALAVLACALKNYLAFLLQGTVYCKYLCPSLFGRQELLLPEFLNTLFALQNRIPESAGEYLDLYWSDPYRVFPTLLIAPLVEEIVYRGPLVVLRKKVSDARYFWVAAAVLTLLFTLSHDLSGLSLLPIFVMGLCSSWLVFRTRRIWPSLFFHMLYNGYFLSITLYQSLFWSD